MNTHDTLAFQGGNSRWSFAQDLKPRTHFIFEAGQESDPMGRHLACRTCTQPNLRLPLGDYKQTHLQLSVSG